MVCPANLFGGSLTSSEADYRCARYGLRSTSLGLIGAAYSLSRELWRLWRRRRAYRSLTRRRFGCRRLARGCRGLARARDEHHGEH